MKEEKKNNKKLRIAIVVIVAFFALLVYAYMAYISYNNGTISTIYGVSDKGNVTYIKDGVDVDIPFTTDNQEIYGINLPISTSGDLQNGTIRVSILSEQGEVLASCEKNSLIESDTRYAFTSPVQNTAGRKLTLKVECESESDKVYLLGSDLVLEDGSYAPAFGVIVSGKDSYFKLQNVVYPILILVIVSTFAVVLLDTEHKIKPEQLYLIAGLGFGLIFVLIIPITAAPDEITHMYTSYDVSDKIMGTHGSTVMMRADDVMADYSSKNLTRNDYLYEYDGIFDGVNNSNMVDSGVVATGYPRYLYWMSGLGITVGRLLGFGTTLIYLLGRIFNMLAFVFAVYYSIKRMPFGKGIVFVWALLPITLQQTGSFSYDSPVLTLSILVAATALSAIYGEEQSKKKKIINYIVWVVSTILLIPCKGHALIPLAMLVLMLIPRYIRTNRDKIEDIRAGIRPWMKIVLIAGCVLFLCVVGIVAIRIIKIAILPENINNNYIAWADQNGYTIGFFIKHPVRLLEIMVNTVWFKSDIYLNQMLGGSLGWLEIEIPWVFILGFLVLLIYAAMRKESEPQLIRTGERVYIIIVSVGVVVLAIAGMLLYWTPNSLFVVEGVQGRYFLPALVPGLLALRTKKNSVSDNADYNVIMWTVLLHLFVVTAVFKNIL